ncbi:hypothetical protein DRH14_00660 [Candidatus Shapirobacteria bacterium]|nr:MAG: hypothetical protein DRH14_00660 [Candidatus Shapirobacteria bacterium]
MKKILKSILILTLVISSAYGVAKSGAWFTDEEQVLGNRIDTGTIDIAVNELSNTQMNLIDMKPGQVDYLDYIIHNTGSNPANIFKVLYNNDHFNVDTSEPECLAEGGTWDESTSECSSNTPIDNLGTQIKYDMRVELYNGNPDTTGERIWWETIYLDSDDVKLSTLWNDKMSLGMVPAGWYLKVMQSYHMDEEAGNEYQGDALTFDIRFEAEQLGKSVLVLENKYEANGADPHHVWDGISATLGYSVRDRTFDYSLTTAGISGDYTLIAWESPDNSWTWADRESEAVVLAHISGNVTGLQDSVELNRNLINAKVWLVPGNFGTVGGLATGFTEWTGSMPTDTLFDTGLMDYYDADIY